MAHAPHWLKSFMSLISSACHDECFSLIFTYLPFYFNLSFPVFFHSSVLMHPDLHTDIDNLDSVEKKPCATPPRGALTPTTSSIPSQVMSPTTTVSNELVKLPGFLLLHYSVIGPGYGMTRRSASCSPKHTENTPITAVRKVCLSVSRHCLSCSIERRNPWEKAAPVHRLGPCLMNRDK